MQSRSLSRTWLWLLLALWLLSQSWAWVHRVEHAPVWQKTAAHAVSAQASADAEHHAGASCEWLDHALLGGAAPCAAFSLSAQVAPSGLAPAPCCSAPLARAARPYLARAPPHATEAFEGRFSG